MKPGDHPIFQKWKDCIGLIRLALEGGTVDAKTEAMKQMIAMADGADESAALCDALQGMLSALPRESSDNEKLANATLDAVAGLTRIEQRKLAHDKRPRIP